MSAPGPDGGNFSKESVEAAVEEAKNAPTPFSPRERAEYVKERVSEIRNLRALGKNDLEIKAALGDFVEKYPHLFQAAVEPNFDMREFNLQLRLLNDMANGMTMHQASVIAGQSAFNRFATPQINRMGGDPGIQSAPRSGSGSSRGTGRR